MTKEYAIKILNREKVATVSERNEALDMAIDALENERPQGEWIENKRYKRKGKMTNEEAKVVLERHLLHWKRLLEHDICTKREGIEGGRQ